MVLSCVNQVGKTRDAIGLDGEVVNRRRTISGPVTELVAAARRDQPTPMAAPRATVQPESSPPPVNSPSPHPPSSPHPGSGGSGSSSENLPFAEEGSLTIRRQGRGEGEGQVDISIYVRLLTYLSVCYLCNVLKLNVLRCFTIHSQASVFCKLLHVLSIYQCFSMFVQK